MIRFFIRTNLENRLMAPKPMEDIIQCLESKECSESCWLVSILLDFYWKVDVKGKGAKSSAKTGKFCLDKPTKMIQFLSKKLPSCAEILSSK